MCLLLLINIIIRVTQIVIRVTMSEMTLKINAVKWPRIYIQT